MGRYDAIFAAEEELDTALTADEAILGIAIVAFLCDGEVLDEEAVAIQEIATGYGLLEDYETEEIQAIIDKLFAIASEQSLGSLLNISLNSLPEDWTETAFEVAATIVLSDEAVDKSEDSFLEALAEALELDQETAQGIIDGLLEGEEAEE